MPWQDCRPMDHRVLFIADCLRGGHSMSELCRLHGISRKTGYKWLRRYQHNALDGLAERSRRPGASPHQVPFTVRQRIIALRRCRSMVLGPKKIQALLAREFEHVPSKTTIYNILRAEGLIQPRRRRRRVPGYEQPFAPVTGANDVWTVDFKGQFQLADKCWCYPLTVMDLHSRFLLACKAQPCIATTTVRQHFEILFRRHGLPRRIRSDNGTPFASRAVGGLSRLSVWWLKLGILPERIQPGQPQQNGAHERMHETLKQAATQPSSRHISAQQRRFDGFRNAYNTLRPHEALGQQVPASHYQSSPRPFPEQIAEPAYPDWYQIKRVGPNGLIYLSNRQIYISTTLETESIGIEQVAETVYDVYFGPLRLGAFDLKDAARRKSGSDYLSLRV